MLGEQRPPGSRSEVMMAKEPSWKDEGALVGAIVVAVLKHYPTAYVVKVHGGMYQESGIPDLDMTIEGLAVKPEVKHQKPGESYMHAIDRTTQKQRIHIARIVRAGGMAGTVTTPQETLDLIKLAFLKQKMMARGVPEDQLPLPPHWDFLMKPDPDKVIIETEPQIDPVPNKRYYRKP